MSKIRKLIRSRGAGIALAVAAAAVAVVAGVVGLTNWHMIASVDDTIAYTFDGEHEQLSEDALKRIDDFNAQCIIVPGASVYPNGNPSPMLRNRLDAADVLYKSGGAPAILLSGDNGEEEYNEVRAMAGYIKEQGVEKEDIFCDIAGFSTYETAFRAKEVFDVDRAIVVTQSYHMYRAAYGCIQMGTDVIGVCSDQQIYRGQTARDGRELLARTKDVIKWNFKPDPTFLGEEIPVTGKGNCPF